MKKDKKYTVYFAITEESRYNPGYYKVFNDSLWDTRKELTEWIKSMKKNRPYYTDYDKLKLKSAKITFAQHQEGSVVLGSWLYHPTKGLTFARSTWQGD